MQPEHLQKIMGYYIEDAKAHLKVIEQHLLHLQSTIEDPNKVNHLFHITRCGIVGGTSLLPISSTHINSIHKTGLCLVDCFKVFQLEGSLKADQKLKDLLMQVFYILKELIEKLSEPSSLTEDKTEQLMSQMESVREALRTHLNLLVKQSHQTNWPEVARAKLSSMNGAAPSGLAKQGVNTTETLTAAQLDAVASKELAQLDPDSADDIPSLEELQLLIDELSQ